MAGEEKTESDSETKMDIEALRTTHEEARTVLDHQIESVRNLDDKAAKTFRLDAVFLGLTLTAVSLLVRSDSFQVSPFVNAGTVAGVIALIASFIFAVLTFTVTDMHSGIGPADIERLVDEKYTEEEWLALLVRSEAAWMAGNEKQQSLNVKFLIVSHVALLIAIICFSVGIVYPLL